MSMTGVCKDNVWDRVKWKFRMDGRPQIVGMIMKSIEKKKENCILQFLVFINKIVV